MKKTVYIVFLLLFMSCKTPPLEVQQVTYRKQTFDALIVDLKTHEINFFLQNKKKQKFKSLGRLKKYLEKQGQQLVFATNAGMYLSNNIPQGLYIENGQKIRPIDLSDSKRALNFYMKPNGVFLLTDKQAFVVESSAIDSIEQKISYATQSGPVLLLNGELHPKFNEGSTSKYIRSGVGIMSDGKVIFAISNERVNFYDFAMLFKEVYNCKNALYLDGAISKMYLPALGRRDTGGNFGAIIGIVE